MQTLIVLATGFELLGKHVEGFTAGTELIINEEHVVLDAFTLRALEVTVARIDVDHPFDRGDFLEVVEDSGHQRVGFLELSFVVLIDEGKRIILLLERLVFTRALSTGGKSKQHCYPRD